VKIELIMSGVVVLELIKKYVKLKTATFSDIFMAINYLAF
jgi:hypothetical protein